MRDSEQRYLDKTDFPMVVRLVLLILPLFLIGGIGMLACLLDHLCDTAVERISDFVATGKLRK